MSNWGLSIMKSKPGWAQDEANWVSAKQLGQPYLWKLLQDLARAVYAMDNPTGDGLPGDSFVGHIDFKPENIFLCMPDESEFPKYPIAKLADFGGAIVSGPYDDRQTHRDKMQTTAMTNGYVAPEVLRFRLMPGENHEVPARDSKPGVTLHNTPRRITTAVNVWNLGLIIAELMCPKKFYAPALTLKAYDARDAWIDDFVKQKDSMTNYSELLKDTVICCLKYFPDQRPTPTQLLTLIDKGVKDHAGLMQNRDCLDPKKYNGQHDLPPKVAIIDKYIVTHPEDEEDWEMTEEIYPQAGTSDEEHWENVRRSTAVAGAAPQDTPMVDFVLGPRARTSLLNFFGAAPRIIAGTIDTAGIADALNNDMVP
ncbi:hypothetical protein AUEXF2481DRAFT_6376 [Aureobasidium subglaciale EXF-2481]|uniref:non-specific serine/threonine protein kinase n=1 Tax=Aureobasidium subglaciale (strain EXF-2481) TaxID=1043005 RepID=A0A074YI78_AURSE|nr:uncharacterized protein AUEXF2481DRAFT_6376 [Aureobasidium subglaciale EXF-2481]KEQ93792.1 hypothetical protein AUEXF2481DRAFT_6376 [Aureobasidium subglaciale EXF-2481]